ncbi:cell division protein [Lactobacillus nasalidis]|uniref:Cell division protein n=1 Tax=Lactobacillus nasalidis TaxID=2797258 RepID=A0ABQ3W9L1_9LACO|nr:hypothetical protein [Lactobacillus nasalidis]GHV96991.1 cell division protein [Lactobacillus nasalidis]GHV99015.1 cell division protein [Lactobacillus nasalidis]GHW02040.1 cell division protein [Lactobacillus nasalidis]
MLTDQTKKWLKEGTIVLIAAVLAAYLVSAQVKAGQLIIGSDSIFHFNRIYEAAQQIKTGNYSWFMSIYGFHQSGRIVNAFYGPLFAYLLGLLLLLAGSWYRFQLLTSFLVYFLACLGMYRAGRRVGGNRLAALWSGAVYLTVGWLARWEMGSNFSAITALLAPWLMLAIVDLLDLKQAFPVKRLVLLLFISLESHMLTALLFSAALLPAAVYRLVKEGKPAWVKLGKAAGICLLLTMNYWLPLVYFGLTNQLVSPGKMSLAGNALHLTQKTTSKLTGLLLDSSTRDQLSELMLGLFAVQLLACLLLISDRTFAGRLNRIFTLSGAGLLYLSSALAPWDKIERALPFLASYLQFPSRLASLAYAFLLLGTVLTVKQLEGRHLDLKLGTALALVLAIVLFFDLRYLRNQIYTNAVRGYMPGVAQSKTTKMGSDNDQDDRYLADQAAKKMDPGLFLQKARKMVPDYLPAGGGDFKQVEAAYKQVVLGQHFFAKKTAGQTIQLSWISSKDGKIRLPLVLYRQSRLTVNGQQVKVKPGAGGLAAVKSWKGKNTASLSLKLPVWLPAALGLSLLADLLAGIYLLGWTGKRLLGLVNKELEIYKGKSTE